MLVLVTGATGFLGSHVARQLLGRGDQVRVLMRTTSDASRLDGLTVERAIGDVTDQASVLAAVHGVDAVIHCAAVVEFGAADPTHLERVNVGGARAVLDAAVAEGIRVVHVSSLAALGPTEPGKDPKDEQWWHPGPFEVAYERTKRAAHEHARSLAAAGGAVRIGAPGGIYGHGDQSSMAQLIEVFSRWSVPIGYLPDVRQTTVNVHDCADGLLRILDGGPELDGAEFILGAESVAVADWLAIICRAGGHRPPLVNLPTSWVRAMGRPGATVAGWFGQPRAMVTETVAVATHDSAYSGQKLRDELGWEPRTLEVGMRDMVDAIRAERVSRRRAR